MAANLRGRIDNTDRLARTLANVARRASDDPFKRTRRVISSGLPNVSPNDIANRQIIAKDFRTALNVGTDAAGVVFDSDGIRGYNSSVTKTFDIGTDGSGFLGTGTTKISWGTTGTVSVPGSAIDAGTVDTLQLAAAAVTHAKIAVDAIQEDVIQAAAITETKIEDGAISTPKLAAGAVTAAKIEAGTITATEIASNAVTSVKINAGAVTSDKITVSTLSAITANLGSITAGTVTGATIRSASSGDRVEIDSTGLTLHGPTSSLFQFRATADGSIVGKMWSHELGIGIEASRVIIDGTDVVPSANGGGSLGASDAKWGTAYINSVVVGTSIVASLITSGTNAIQLHSTAGSNTIGFFGATPVVKQSISGSRSDGTALADLLTSLDALGLIVDGSTA